MNAVANLKTPKIVMQAKGLVKRYGQVTALDGVDFELREGEILAVIVGVFRNGLTLMGVSSVYQVLITGVLVILAVATDQLSRKGVR